MAPRMEHDFLGDLEIPEDVYYGVQTLRAIQNFPISNEKLSQYPTVVKGLAYVKYASAKANAELGTVPQDVADAICAASKELLDGKLHDQFPIGMIQGGAGTSANMNANEVIANRALEILGFPKGDYKNCSPNDHVNCSQSTNDVYPTAIKLSMIMLNQEVVAELKELVAAFRRKGKEFAHVLKMGRTQLQDAVPMTVGSEFEAFASNLEEDIGRLTQNVNLFLEVNMGATAIGTGITADPGYKEKCVSHLQEITGFPIVSATNLIEATSDTGAFVIYSSACKRLAVKLSKICNDLRLLSSGPRCGFNEINLPPMQPGSSIMPGKVNPVIPEVVNQIAFRVFGNDLTVTFASEAGQMQLNAFEPIIALAILESNQLLIRGMKVLRERCIDGITCNEDRCAELVRTSIGIVTALVPALGYAASAELSREALKTGRGVYDLVLEKKLLTEAELADLLSPQNMLQPRPRKFHYPRSEASSPMPAEKGTVSQMTSLATHIANLTVPDKR
eukprot:comp19523_c0_seq1/m.22840 comp19523_c0_seq1/g.22840  ORF comp19523_c0_seq1/g.22840 comp19523_c0_seq1/m.22840 type:complete len:505 (-) comp19523_c0_seq1:39-1553(-)